MERRPLVNIKHHVCLLDADPELAAALAPGSIEGARRHVVAPAGTVPRGPWDAETWHSPAEGDLGLLVLEGLVLHEVDFASRGAAELLGSGDLLRPWEPHAELLPVPAEVRWTALAPLHIAVLDADFTLAAARWPALMAVMLDRASRRSRALVFQLALSQVTGIEHRLLLLLWEMAQRWGHVGPNGVVIRIKLPREALARLVGARRPTVSTALGGLQDGGSLSIDSAGHWVLHQGPLQEPAGPPPSHG